jgi:hypothetical protein
MDNQPNDAPNDAPNDGASDAHRGWLAARVLLALVAILALVGAFVGVAVLNRVNDTYEVALTLTRDTADAAADASASAVEIATGVSELSSGASSTLTATQQVLDSAATAADEVGTALSTNVADAVDGTASIANRLARFVEVVERFIPGNTDSLAEDLREFADGIEPVPDQLRALGAELATTSDEIDAASASLGPVSDQLTSTASDLAAATTDIEQAAEVANEIAARAQAQLDASNSTFSLAKVLLFVLALVIALTCVAGERVISVAQRRSAVQRA